MAEVISTATQIPRMNRRPKHTWYHAIKPFHLAPTMIAPVLPGETLKDLTCMARAVSDPLVSSIVGAWDEHYVFYVPVTSIDESYEDMFTDPSWDNTALIRTSETVARYTQKGTADWVSLCMDTIASEFFYDDGDTLQKALGYNLTKVVMDNWLQSVVAYTDITDATAAAHIDDLDDQMAAYQAMRLQTMAEMSYDEYLKEFGVRLPRSAQRKPEIIRFVREWTYPSNTINPTDGAPSSAWSWLHNFKGATRKNFYIREPGFIIGCQVTRPKTYYAAQRTNGASLMTGPERWFPFWEMNKAEASIEKISNTVVGEEIVDTVADDLAVDLRDLLIYGDQFTDDVTQGFPLVALPDSAADKKYATAAIAEAAFSGTGKLVTTDGAYHLTIAGKQRDTT